jgi:hypothetical protein
VRALAASAVFQGPLAEIAAAAAPDAVRAENAVPSTCVVRRFFFFEKTKLLFLFGTRLISQLTRGAPLIVIV